MIERISNKSTYAAIDPVFAQPPSHGNGNEPFDAALSRASTPKSSSELSAREVEQRDRDRDAEVSDRGRVGRDEAAAKTDRPRDRDERPDRTDNREPDAPRDTPNRPHENSDENVSSDDGAHGDPDRTIGDREFADEVVDDVPGGEFVGDGTEIAVADVVEVVAVAIGDGRQVSESEVDADAKLSSVEDAIAEAKASPAAKTVNTKVDGHRSISRQPATAESDVQVSTTIDAASHSDGEAVDSTSLAKNAAPVKAVSAESGAEVASDKAISNATSPVAASRSQAAIDVVAGNFTPAATTGTSVEVSSKRETRTTARGVAAKGERAANAVGASASAKQAVAAVVAETNAGAAAENTTSSDSGKPQISTSVADARAAATPTQREGDVASESGGQRGIVDRLARGRSAGATRSEASNVESEVQRVRLIQRVARAFQTLGDGGGEVRLRLSPPSLGSIKLEVTMQAGTMSARIETETAAARALLVDNLPSLRERLAAHDIKVSQFDIETSADSRQQNQFAQQDRSEDRAPRGPFQESRQQTHEPPPADVARSHATDSALDVFI